MRLFTISIDNRPILVMSADAETPMPDALTTNANLMKAHRERSARLANPPDDTHMRTEIHAALDTWLGDELQRLYPPVWDGDLENLQIREARTDEAERWYVSRRHAIDAGEQDAGDEDWLLYLVPTDGYPEEAT